MRSCESSKTASATTRTSTGAPTHLSRDFATSVCPCKVPKACETYPPAPPDLHSPQVKFKTTRCGRQSKVFGEPTQPTSNSLAPVRRQLAPSLMTTFQLSPRTPPHGGFLNGISRTVHGEQDPTCFLFARPCDRKVRCTTSTILSKQHLICSSSLPTVYDRSLDYRL